MTFDDELRVARGFLDTRDLPGDVVFLALSGAHMYGFPSPDSDLDLKGAYLAPTERFLGLAPSAPSYDVTAWHDGVENDLTLLELGKSLGLLLSGNGNTVEQIFSPLQVVDTPALSELRELARGALSIRFARHYRGFLRQKRREYEAASHPEVKTLLYGLRVAATGLHLLLEGEVVAHLPTLAPRYGLDVVGELVERKSSGEHTVLDEVEKACFAPIWDHLEAELTDAARRTRLPDAAPNRAAVDAWLVARRRTAI